VGRLDDIIRRNRRAQGSNLVGLAVSTVGDAVDPNADPDDRRRRQIAWAIVLAVVAAGAIAIAVVVRSSGGAPGGTVYDRQGRKVELASLWRDRRVAIMFYPNRACDTCTHTLAMLDMMRDQVDATIIGVGAEPAAQAENLHTQMDLHIELYADPTRDVTTRWGIPFSVADETKHALFVVEPDGRISYKWIAERLGDLPSLEEFSVAVKRR
jgi:glutaredoxin-dependent peroxiredoxin